MVNGKAKSSGLTEHVTFLHLLTRKLRPKSHTEGKLFRVGNWHQSVGCHNSKSALAKCHIEMNELSELCREYVSFNQAI